MDDRIRDLIFQAIDETISPEDFERLQNALEHDAEVRAAYLKTIGLCESLGEIASEPQTPASVDEPMPASVLTRIQAMPDAGVFGSPVQNPKRQRGDATGTRLRRDLASASGWDRRTLAATLAILCAVSGTAFLAGQRNAPTTAAPVAVIDQRPEESSESRISGHATLRRAVGLKWPSDAVRHMEGDVLPNGLFAFDTGTVEIDFFCGATVIVDGPAQLDIESDWSVRVTRGRLRASVPPAARGFVVKAADSEIIDLGTEFALEVDAGNARVEVIDGEIELRGGAHDGRHLQTGEGESLAGTLAATDLAESLSTFSELSRQRQQADERLFERWKQHSQKLRTDDRLIAYYPICEPTALAADAGGQRARPDASAFGSQGRVVTNAALSGTQFNGLLVGPVDNSIGRFGAESTGLEFERTGAGVRTRIDGEFQAFTFSCWVRINSLEHRYNSLFMGDGYENGEPHWQIRDDGRLMFSVMVDDSQEIEHFSDIDQKMVTQAGLHRVYYSPPFWDISKSGQWFHLAAVYSPVDRRVDQYVNGELVSSDEIIDRFHISTLTIGPAEIGNWGQPFRKTPWFAVRNLNGTIDELAIFNAALTADEIQNLYEQGKPVGY
jgi:hypothetical protein